MQTVRSNYMPKTDNRGDRRPLHGEPLSSTDHLWEGFPCFYWRMLRMTSETSVDGREVLLPRSLENGA